MSDGKKVRFLLTRHPLDGHESGYNVLATGLRERGIEVILGGNQFAEQIVETAIQEDVDFIGYRIMSGDPITLVEILFKKLNERKATTPVIVGGIIPASHIYKLKEVGVTQVFGAGSSLNTIADFLKQYQPITKI